ncbi:hypothetical protein [Virgisporangium aurantiacum]|nr:hypothetical protein [Virgisporangium aurantiacum]
MRPVRERGTLSVVAFDLTAVRRGLAENPALPFDLLRPLLDAPDRVTWAALAGRSDLTRAAVRRLATTDSPAVRIALARNPVGAAHGWDLLVDDADVDVRTALADNHWRHGDIPRDFPLPEPAQVRLADDPAGRVRRMMAFRRDPAPAVGRRLAADPSADVRCEVARHWRRAPADVARTWFTDPDPGVRRAALFRHLPPAELVAGLLADPETRAEAAGRVRLVPDTAEDLASDPDPEVRWAVARNPTLPAPLVVRLADDPDPEVRAEIMLRRDLPDDVRARVAASVEPQDYHVAGWLVDAALDVRLAHVDSPFAFCRRAVASSKCLPAPAIARLATDEDFSVRLLLAENHPEVPGAVFATVLPRTGHAAWLLGSHPSIPTDLLVAMAGSDDERDRNVAAISPHLPAPNAVDLAEHRVATTRRCVAANVALPLSAILRLLHDPDSGVVTAAASNPRLPPTAARDLLAAG